MNLTNNLFTSLIMAVVKKGACTVTYHVVDEGEFQCLCSEGQFTLNDNVLLENVRCETCRHKSTDHRESSAICDGYILLTSPEEPKPSESPFKCEKIEEELQPREDLCAGLFDLLQKVRVVHARGTPTTGKTQLGRLFHNFVNENYSKHGKMALVVNALGMHDEANKRRGLSVHDWLQEKTHRKAQRPFEGSQNIDAVPELILIIDEGNATYGDFSFWDSLKDTDSNRNHYLILCTWGSPTETPNKIPVAAADLELPPNQRVGYSRDNGSLSMLFTFKEHQDAIARRIRQYDKTANGFHLDEQTIEYLYDITNGHPGATSAAFEILYEVRFETVWQFFGNNVKLLIII